jgi:hypothetical protein
MRNAILFASAFPMKGKPMNILNRGQFENFGAGLRDRIGNAYEQIAAGTDYRTNENNLRIIQAAVVTVTTTP